MHTLTVNEIAIPWICVFYLIRIKHIGNITILNDYLYISIYVHVPIQGVDQQYSDTMQNSYLDQNQQHPSVCYNFLFCLYIYIYTHIHVILCISQYIIDINEFIYSENIY